MTGKGHGAPNRPDSIGGFKPGDRVITSLGRPARIVGCRVDGFLDAEYEDRHPSLAAVILQPQFLRRVA
jgi:hypothetical protein